jgi:hypothetical protein
MLRIERVFEAEGIEDELSAYNPLIPDGSNWKATFMIEFADVDERRVALMRMVGIESRVWVQVAGFADGTEARAARQGPCLRALDLIRKSRAAGQATATTAGMQEVG